MILRRRSLFNKPQSGALPSGFKPCTYIQSSGKQYIITTYYPTGDTEFEAKYEQCEKEGVLFGTYNGDWSNLSYGYYINTTLDSGNPFLHYCENIRLMARFHESATVTFKNEVITVNDKPVTIKKKSFRTVYPLAVLNGNWSRNFTYVQKPIIKLHFLKMAESSELKLNLIPALRVSDNKPGMYDTVTKSFFTNQGEGEFGYELMDGTYVAPV